LEEKFELLQFMKIVKERKFVIILGTLFCLLFAKVATDYASPVYESSVQMMISQGQVTSQTQPLVESYQATLLSERLTATFSQMLVSRTLAERVIGKLDLSTTPENLQRRIKAEAVEETQLIRFTVTGTDPDFTKRLADTYASEFMEMTDEVIPSSALINVRVVDRAAMPNVPVWPNPVLNLVQAFLVGLVLSTGFAFILGMLDVSIKEKEEVEKLINLPALGQIPVTKNPLLFGSLDPVVAEAYLSLRTNLQYINFDQSIKSLIVSSPSLNEGKTTVSFNLAVVFAQAGYNVLLIDSDLRSPRLGRLFSESANKEGLSNILIGTTEVESAIQGTQIDGLYFIASGPTPPNPANLLNSERMDKLLRSLEDDFDLVIIDCPPIMAVADTPILAVKADAVLLVSSFRKTKKSEMNVSKDALDKVGARITGFVINGVEAVNRKKFDYYYRRPQVKQKAA